MEECLVGMAAVKALRAEGDIQRRVAAARAREMWGLQRIALLKAVNYSLQVGRPVWSGGCGLAAVVCVAICQLHLFFYSRVQYRNNLTKPPSPPPSAPAAPPQYLTTPSPP
jgi:hypothetical protein